MLVFGKDGWFALTHSVVSHDHPHFAFLEQAITIDFVNRTRGPSARAALARAIEAAEIEARARSGEA